MKKSLIWIAVVPFLWIGCASGPYSPESDPHSPEAVGKKVVLFDEDLEDEVALDRAPIARKNSQDFLRVQASLRNRTDKTIQIQVQVLFKDDKGMVLYSEAGSEAAWMPLILSPNETQSFSQTALSARATQYGIRVRYLNRHGK